MAAQDFTTKGHTIMRTTIRQYDVNQAVTQGHERATVHPGGGHLSPTLWQRREFASAFP
jgi:hypothetical protein